MNESTQIDTPCLLFGILCYTVVNLSDSGRISTTVVENKTNSVRRSTVPM